MKTLNISWPLSIYGVSALLCYGGSCRVSDATPLIAYLDPGAGSLILQIIVGGALGVMFIVKLFWRRCLSFVKRVFHKSPDKAVPVNNFTPRK